MNKKTIVASLNKIANELDINCLYKEANTVTQVMIRMADEFNMTDDENMPMVNPKTFQKPMEDKEPELPTPEEDSKEKRRQQILKEVLDTQISPITISNEIRGKIYRDDINDSSPTTYRKIIDSFFRKLANNVGTMLKNHYTKTSERHSYDEFIQEVVARFIQDIERNEQRATRFPLPPIRFYINQKYRNLVLKVAQLEEEFSAYHDF